MGPLDGAALADVIAVLMGNILRKWASDNTDNCVIKTTIYSQLLILTMAVLYSFKQRTFRGLKV